MFLYCLDASFYDYGHQKKNSTSFISCRAWFIPCKVYGCAVILLLFMLPALLNLVWCSCFSYSASVRGSGGPTALLGFYRDEPSAQKYIVSVSNVNCLSRFKKESVVLSSSITSSVPGASGRGLRSPRNATLCLSTV